jgi:hypothetical protein
MIAITGVGGIHSVTGETDAELMASICKAMEKQDCIEIALDNGAGSPQPLQAFLLPTGQVMYDVAG